MSISKITKRTIKIAVATGAVIFSLTTVFTSTYAWFSLSKIVKASNMSTKVRNVNGRLDSIDIYKFDKMTTKNNKNYYSFENEASAHLDYNWSGSGTGVDLFELGDYSPLKPEHPLLLVFTLSDTFYSSREGDMFIKGETSVGSDDRSKINGQATSGFLGDIDSNNKPLYNLNDVTPTLKNGSKRITVDQTEVTVGLYPLSSVVNFKCASYTTAQFAALEDTENAHIDIEENSVKLNQSFVNYGVGSAINFIKAPTIFSSTGSGSFDCVAMVINYDKDAITTIYSTYLGNSILEDTYLGALCYYCDWCLEVF